VQESENPIKELGESAERDERDDETAEPPQGRHAHAVDPRLVATGKNDHFKIKLD